MRITPALTSLSTLLRRYQILLALTFVVCASTWTFHSSASKPSSGATNTGTGQNQQGNGQSKKDACPHCAPEDNQVIYIPLIELPEAKESELVFNSRSPETMAVTPTFYKADGTTVVGDVVHINAAEIRYVKIKKLLPQSHRDDRDWGGMSLSYYGGNREMWAQLRFLNVNGGGSVDEFFTVQSESRSDYYEAAWWAPQGGVSIVALGNLTDAATNAVVKFGDSSSQTVNLAPHATKVVRSEVNSLDGPASITIQVGGAPGSIVPTGIIASADGSFNSVIRFYNPKVAKQPNLYANGFRIKNIAAHMVLKNTTADWVTAKAKFITLGGVAEGQPVVTPEIMLGPNEAREIDISQLTSVAKKRTDLDVASVEVTSSGPAGSLIGSLYGIDKKSGLNYEAPLRDSGPVRTMTGSYPWNVSKDYTTLVYITNISDREAGYIAQITHVGGSEPFIFDPGTLKPGETAVFDLARIRDEQKKDTAGRRLPKEASVGQFKWAVRGVTGGKLLLIGRAEMVSQSERVSTSYSCNDPCPPRYGGSIDPFLPPIVIVNATSGPTKIWESAVYDSGFTIGPYAVGAEWTVDNASLATCTPSIGHSVSVCGDAAGSGFLTAFIRNEQSYGYDGRDCYDNYSTYPVEGGQPLEVAVNIAKLQYQSSSGFVDIDGTIHVLQGTPLTFKAIPSPSNATFPPGKPTWGGSSNATGSGQTTTVVFPTVSNSAGDYKTVTATAGGNTVTAQVVVFALQGVWNPAINFSGRSYDRYGVEEDVTLGFQTNPSNIDVGGLRWKITSSGGTANGTLNPNDTGGGTYKAPDTARTVGVKLELLEGPSKGQGPSYNITIVEPNGGYVTQVGTGIKHTFNSWSAGFLGDIHILPADVSFYNLFFYEGSAPAVTSGWLAEFNDPHPVSAVAVAINSQNVVSVEDQIFSGVKFGPYGEGFWYWDIPWVVRTASNRNINIGTFRQLATSNNAGTAVMSKGGWSVSRVPSDPTSSW